MYEESVSLPLETNGEGGRRAAVVETHKFATNRSITYHIRIWGLWLQVAGLDGDALGDEERSNGIWPLDGPLPFTADFC
jgi:hypothetical protein